MKNKNILATILLTVSTLALTACGNSAASASAAETEKNQVVESTITADVETSIAESSTTENVSADKQGEISGHEVNTNTEEDDLANFPIIDPNFNGAGHTGTLKETVQSYITYEDIDPVTMYATKATPTYHDLNVSEGELVESGLVEPNQEIIVDGKGTYNNIEYYRIEFQEAMMLSHHIIIPAEYLSAEKQEIQKPEVQKPVETQKPVEQQPEVQQPQQPTQQPQQPQQSTDNSTVTIGSDTFEWDESLGVSKEDWDAFFGSGHNTTGQRTWQPDGNDNMTIDENGNIWDPDLIDGVLTFN